MRKYKIKEAVVVEGIYDKNKIASFLDGTIITTHGFAVFKSDDFARTIARLACKDGIVILTDSDSAGIKIRNFIKQRAAGGRVLHAYVPDIEGVEKRKRRPSAEGLLGVEGMSEEIIINALRSAGCTIDDAVNARTESKITKSDLFSLGLSGGAGARELRRKVAVVLEVPAKLSSNMLLEVINRLLTYDELVEIVQKIKDDA